MKCSLKRFRILLYGTSAKVMLDRGKIGVDFWEALNREKETAKKLCALMFKYEMHENFDDVI